MIELRDWDLDRIAAAAGATAANGGRRGASAAGPERVVIDSRDAGPGALFVGLRGEHADGGEFAAQALRAGAWGVLVAPEYAERAADSGAEGALIAHPDPLAGLQGLAGAWLAELKTRGARVVAITGSTGKTSTKDILAAILSRTLRTVASPRNFNTEIGLPLAVLGAPAGTEALVLELAMRGPGQIAELTGIVRPEVGVIVNIGPVHLELLGSLGAIAAAKAELIAGLSPGTTVVIPAEPLLQEYLRADVHTVTFGSGGDVSLAGGEDGQILILDRSRRDHPPEVIALEPSFGEAHQLNNLLAAVAAARALGVTPEGRVEVSFSAHRGQRLTGRDGIVVIDDCYNANPMSMRAAIDELCKGAGGRRVAVLGRHARAWRAVPRLSPRGRPPCAGARDRSARDGRPACRRDARGVRRAKPGPARRRRGRRAVGGASPCRRHRARQGLARCRPRARRRLARRIGDRCARGAPGGRTLTPGAAGGRR